MSLNKRGRPCIPMDSRLASVAASSSPLFLEVKSEKKTKKFGSRTVFEHDPAMSILVKKRNKNTINSRIKTSFGKKQLYNEINSLLDRVKQLTGQSKPNTVKNCSLTIIKPFQKLDDRQKRNIKAALYRNQNNQEWEELKLYKCSLHRILEKGKLDDENNNELENIIFCFSKFKLCSFCQFVFKRDGLLQHENHCKIRLKFKLDSMLAAETPDEIFEENKKIFTPIAHLNPKTYDMLRQCLYENDYIKTYLEHQQYVSNESKNNTNEQHSTSNKTLAIPDVGLFKDNYNNQSNESLEKKVILEECQYNSVAINKFDRVWNAEYGKSPKGLNDDASKHELNITSKPPLFYQEFNFSTEEVMKETFQMSKNILNENIHDGCDFGYYSLFENDDKLTPINDDKLLFN